MSICADSGNYSNQSLSKKGLKRILKLIVMFAVQNKVYRCYLWAKIVIA
jgi:hypothetical protein